MLHNFWPGEAQNELTYQATSYTEAAQKQPKRQKALGWDFPPRFIEGNYKKFLSRFD